MTAPHVQHSSDAIEMERRRAGRAMPQKQPLHSNPLRRNRFRRYSGWIPFTERLLHRVSPM